MGSRILSSNVDSKERVLEYPIGECRTGRVQRYFEIYKSDLTVCWVRLVVGHKERSRKQLARVDRVLRRRWNRVGHNIDRLCALNRDVERLEQVQDTSLWVNNFDSHRVHTSLLWIGFSHVNGLAAAEVD